MVRQQAVLLRSLWLSKAFVDSIPACMQGGGEKLSDDAIEATLDKVVKLLAYISDKDLFSGQWPLAGGRLLLCRAAAGLCGSQRAGPGRS